MSSRSAILIFFLTFSLKDFIAGSDFNLEEERSYPTPVRNSPLLPHLLESLSAQKNSPDTSHDIHDEYDYIVVGAGAAGSVVAARLSEVPCVRVLLLEAGPPPPKLTDIVTIEKSFVSTNLDWQYESTKLKYTGGGIINRKLRLPIGKGLGGSTMRDAGFHVRGNKKDYDDWAMMGAKGWSYEEILPYFRKLEDNRDSEYITDGYHGVGGPVTVERPGYVSELKQPIFEAINAMGYQVVDPNSGRQTGFYDIQSSMRHGQKCSTAKAYLVPAENRTNLDILANAFVRKIFQCVTTPRHDLITHGGKWNNESWQHHINPLSTDGTHKINWLQYCLRAIIAGSAFSVSVIIVGSRAVGVLFDSNGRTYEVHARREVILSAGAIKTPQILMLSGIGPEEHLRQFNIPVYANLPVGMNFQDHVAISIEAVLKPHIQEYADKLADEASIKEYILNRTGPLSSPLGIMYVAFLYNDEVNPGTDFPNYQLYIGESSAKTAQKDWNLKPEVYQQVYGPYKNVSMMSCISQLLHPESRGRIQLRSANPYDQPIIDPNYLADPRDIEDLVAGMKTCKRIYGRPEMKQVIVEPFQTLYPGCEEFSDDEDAYFRCVLRTVLYPFNHYCCTAKMGDTEDPTTVLDPQLRVKYIKGLRVVDASVMPKVTSGNNGVPTIMIGEKAADLIKETVECDDYYCKDGNYPLHHYHQQYAAESKSAAECKEIGGDKIFGKNNGIAESKSVDGGGSFAESKSFAKSFAESKSDRSE